MLTDNSREIEASAPTSRFEHTLFPRAQVHEHAMQMARYLSQLGFDDLPSEVIHLAKLVTLDTIGCIVAGTQTDLGRRVIAAYENGDGPQGCSVLGTQLKLAPSHAAKVNAWLADILDYEDTLSGHPSATVIPAALAMAEHRNTTSRQFLTGLVAGYEAGVRLHDATRATPEAYRRFASYHAWHGVAAGAAAMVVLGGSEEQFRSALGHAAGNTNIPLWYVEYGRPAHALKANYGQMALGGVEAALCARQGILGPFSMLSDPERGFAAIIGSDQFDPSQFSSGLGSTWRIAKTCFKGYPACYALHPTIGAVLAIQKDHNIDPRQIEKVSIRGGAKLASWFSYDMPSSELDGQFSVQYVAAMLLLSKEPGASWHSASTQSDPDVRALLAKTAVELDPAAEAALWKGEAQRASVSIFLKNGQTCSATVDWPPGHPRNPMSEADIERKFVRNLRDTRLEKRAAQIVEMAVSLDRTDSAIADVIQLLRAAET
ncbi:MAG: MmgE/PrpD family protein [Mesorhizobium sp.]|uniref:MmgE/PrpD family protein n=2 Tax=Mesorhizobium TaxID=68287 RepID=UPI000FD578E7|nr:MULTISPECIES: MmgE/PrpD family protein [unclassified Mesorhizobium]RUV80971.1 MmgE/PrpD family protein [Mesorhizobium sp. M1A.F.Ca.IN.020.32.1.1]RWF83123.1 MAG: MmgE/PrpD family protein [Mesorhizobium sp.]RWG06703.1 MAG: MmgE/PrpD family protein [Mesorhizobium sp.]RWG84381.1 MAG: MmgE/PrpD family protein [Mesorhizobium sp.]RWH07408.1 MAG: MmgE/PrpD family protein [Mesorhizobium sp.]